jgi:coenzyme PQQ precursor peptide PqqA
LLLVAATDKGYFSGEYKAMNNWKTPDFVEIRMDAEINCYSSALPGIPKRPILKRSEIADQSQDRES